MKWRGSRYESIPHRIMNQNAQRISRPNNGLSFQRPGTTEDLSGRPFSRLPTRSESLIVWGIALLLLLRFISAATINLSTQEAYYWNYSMHPALSYLDHPPLVAWVIRAGTLLLGKSEIGVRIGGLCLVVVSILLINALGRLWFIRGAGLLAAVCFPLFPFYCVFCAIITPDVPLIIFSSL